MDTCARVYKCEIERKHSSPAMAVLQILSVLALTPLVIVSGLHCPLQGMFPLQYARTPRSKDFADTGDAAVDAVSLCAMCSESNAAVRWNATGDEIFMFMRLRYICRHSNNSVDVVHELNFVSR